MQPIKLPSDQNPLETQTETHCLVYTAESTGASMERMKMPNIRNGSKGGLEPGLT